MCDQWLSFHQSVMSAATPQPTKDRQQISRRRPRVTSDSESRESLTRQSGRGHVNCKPTFALAYQEVLFRPTCMWSDWAVAPKCIQHCSSVTCFPKVWSQAKTLFRFKSNVFRRKVKCDFRNTQLFSPPSPATLLISPESLLCLAAFALWCSGHTFPV